MNVLVYLVPAALGLGLLGLAAFLWSLRSGQYDDMEGAALRVLSDDDVAESHVRRNAAPSSLRVARQVGHCQPIVRGEQRDEPRELPQR